MRVSHTIILVVLCLLGGLAFLLFMEDDAATPPGDTTGATVREGELLYPVGELPAHRVQSIDISPREGDDIILRRTPDGWQQTQPVRFALNASAVDEIVSAIEDLRFIEAIDKDADAPDVRDLFDDPRARLTLRFDDATVMPVQTLYLGSDLTLGSRAYLRRGEQAFIVHDSLHRLVLDAEPASWRQRALNLPTLGQAREIAVAHDDTSLRLAKQPAGDWRFVSPGIGSVDPQAVGELMAAVNRLLITRFIEDLPPSLANYGLAAPTLTLSLVSRNTGQAGQPDASSLRHTLAIGGPTDPTATHLYAALSSTIASSPRPDDDEAEHAPRFNIVFTLPTSQVEPLFVTAKELRDRRLIRSNPTAIRGLVVQRADDDASYTLTRTVDGWDFAADDPRHGEFTIDQASADALLEQLADVRGDIVDETPPTATDTADRIELIISTLSQPAAETVTLERDGDLIYATWRGPADSNEPPTTLRLQRDDVGRALLPALSLRERVIVNLGGHLDAVTSIETRTPEGQPLVIDRVDPGGANPWAAASGVKIDQAAVRQLLLALAPLRATAWPAAPPHSDPHLLTITLDAEQTITLSISADDRTGRLGADPAVFTLAAPAVEAITADLRDRTILTGRTSDVMRVTIRDHGEDADVDGDGITITHARDGTFESAGGQSLDSRAVAGIYDALSALTAAAFRDDSAWPGIPIRTLEARYRDGSAVTIEIAEDPDGAKLARIATDGADQPMVVQLQTMTWTKLLGNPLAPPESGGSGDSDDQTSQL